MVGKKVLITAGPTRKLLTRYAIYQSFYRKNGYAIAKAAAYRGAEVTLVTGPVAIKTTYVCKGSSY